MWSSLLCRNYKGKAQHCFYRFWIKPDQVLKGGQTVEGEMIWWIGVFGESCCLACHSCHPTTQDRAGERRRAIKSPGTFELEAWEPPPSVAELGGWALELRCNPGVLSGGERRPAWARRKLQPERGRVFVWESPPALPYCSFLLQRCFVIYYQGFWILDIVTFIYALNFPYSRFFPRVQWGTNNHLTVTEMIQWNNVLENLGGL